MGGRARTAHKLYRGTGYSLALGTGTLGMRLEKAGVAGMITSRTKFSGFPNPFPAADNGRGRGFGGRGTPGPASAAAAADPARRSPPAVPSRPTGGDVEVAAEGAAARARGSGGWGTIEVFETYNTIAPAVTLTCEDYGLLFRLAENNQKPVVRLDLDAQLLGEQPVFNTSA